MGVKKGSGPANADSRVTALLNLEDQSVCQLPTHRVCLSSGMLDSISTRCIIFSPCVHRIRDAFTFVCLVPPPQPSLSSKGLRSKPESGQRRRRRSTNRRVRPANVFSTSYDLAPDIESVFRDQLYKHLETVPENDFEGFTNKLVQAGVTLEYLKVRSFFLASHVVSPYEYVSMPMPFLKSSSLVASSNLAAATSTMVPPCPRSRSSTRRSQRRWLT
jgi:hypothetical protein